MSLADKKGFILNSIIVGYGQIGKALFEVLSPVYDVSVYDPLLIFDTTFNEPLSYGYNIMHICFPYSDDFISQVKQYQDRYQHTYTVIHSTVPPGTSRECNAIHSPCIGLHPDLADGLLAFTKFLSGKDASFVADYFRRARMKVYLFDKQETTEVMKILSTTFFALMVEYTKEVKTICDRLDIPFEAWTLWTDNHNQGVIEQGREEHLRPNLVPIMKPLGGHCLLPNCEMLENDFTDLIKNRNR